MRPVDCPGHIFDHWPFGDIMVCKTCRMGVTGQSVAAIRRKGETLASAARRAAILELESDKEPYIYKELT